MLHAPDLLAAAIVIGGTTLAAAIDLRTRRVPNALTATLALTGCTIAAAGMGRIGLGAAFLGCAVGLVLMLPGHVFGRTGAGDVKLLAASGTLLGAGTVFRAFLYTAIAGGALALVVALRRRRLRQTLRSTAHLVGREPQAAAIDALDADNRFAYAPAVAIGTALAALGW